MKLFSGLLEKELKLAQMRQTTDEWLRYCAAAGALLFVLGVSLGHYTLAPLMGVLGFAGVYKYPTYRKKQIVGEVERELPLAMRSMATLLSIGLPFEEALRQSCSESELAQQIKMVLREVELGASLPEALNSMVSRIESSQLQKTVMQLNSIYEKKGDSGALKKLSEEIVSIQQSMLKEYSGKLVVYSLVFIAISAILPALFQAYVIVGSTFMSSTISAGEAFWIPVAAFPMVDVAVLAFIKLKKPFFA